ncbi:MAG TPA: hypothetical protein VGV13_09820 [Methylomirabilota bacterium]|nr:hypothetical protein [Methylomirabilota bacterium]
MRQIAPAVRWATLEVVLRDATGKLDSSGERPFSDALPGDGPAAAKTAIQKMRLVESQGWPAALLNVRDEHGKPRIEQSDEEEPPIYILKCKPACWRLYFYVDHGRHFFVYLYAKCKRKQRRDPEDSVRARRIRASLGPGGDGIDYFRFPDRVDV